MIWFIAPALALLAGALLPTQAIINGKLSAALGTPLMAALVSFTVGTCLIALVLLSQRPALPQNLAAIPWWQWTLGGLMGSSYLVLVIALTPRLGVALTFSLIVAGQTLTALLLDHLGFLGIPQHAINLPRVIGAVLLVAGVVLIRRF